MNSKDSFLNTFSIAETALEQLLTNKPSRFLLEASSDGIISGCSIFEQTMSSNTQLEIKWHIQEGDPFLKGQKILTLIGTVPSQQKTLACHYLMHLSSVSSQVNKFVKAYKDQNCIWLSSLRSTPEIEHLESQAFVNGGGTLDKNDPPIIRITSDELRNFGGALQLKENLKGRFSPQIFIIVTNFDDLMDLKHEAIDGICLKDFKNNEIFSIKSYIKNWNVKFEVLEIKNLSDPDPWIEIGIKNFRFYRPFYEWVSFDFISPWRNIKN